MKRILFLLSLYCLPFCSNAQGDNWDYRFRSKFEILLDSITFFNGQQNYQQAAFFFQKLLTNYDALPEEIFINGIAIYKSLAVSAETPSIKFAYADTLLSLYNQRVQLYGDSINSLNKKCFDYFMITKDYADQYEKTFSLYNNFFIENPSGLNRYNFFPYAYLANLLYRNNQLSKENYLKVMQNIRAEVKNRPSTSAWIEIEKNLDKFNIN